MPFNGRTSFVSVDVPVSRWEKLLTSFRKSFVDILQTIVFAASIAVVIYLFVASPHQVDGRSMDHTFEDKQLILASKLLLKKGKPKRGDVVIFKYDERHDYIKRVIGVPGDQVQLRDCHFYINGKQIDESDYLDPSICTGPGHFLTSGKTVTIPDEEYLLIGDNRPGSTDGREFGTIERTRIKGKVFLIYWPITEAKIIRDPEINWL